MGKRKKKSSPMAAVTDIHRVQPKSKGIQAHTNVIGSDEYMRNTLPATEGLQAAAIIADVVGEGGARLVAVVKGLKGTATDDDDPVSMLDREVDTDALGIAVKAITAKMSEGRTIGLVKVLLTGLRKNAAVVNFDTEFAANYAVLFDLIAWSLSINFSGFLDSALVVGLIRDLGVMLEQPSIGDSGESS